MSLSPAAVAPAHAATALPGWAIALGAWGLLVFGIGAAMLALPHGAIFYTLDDPYIHLALAERIAHGHYGMNLDEVTAPASSILWPFLLLPGVGTAWHVWLPLAINLACGAATCVLLGRMVDLLPWSPGQVWARAALLVLLVLAGNLAALAFTGMEHNLQVLLAAGCAWGVAEAMRGRPIPLWCLAAAAIGPAVRYEALALVGALMIALSGQRRWAAAAGLLAAALLVPLGFGAWLMAQGLPPLPNSVLAKTGAEGGMLAGILGNLATLATNPRRWPYLALTALLLALAMRSPPVRRWPLLGAVAALGLHAVVGKFGWFFRYEVYAALFGALVLLVALVGTARPWRIAGALVVLGLGLAQAPANILSPRAAQNIQDQHFQMHRFVAEYWKRDVAVNDLGWVSYRIDPRHYVLDLYGLASNEALRQRVKDAAWLEQVVGKRGIKLAILYPWWFQGIPEGWVPLGNLWLSGPRVAPNGDNVTFYATDPAAAAELRALLGDFARTLPDGVRFTPR
ncbi:hypothetical protein [Paracraurococcus ruber]|uniref:Glycosyltransferase RgtA/B/C/D-like domain-containing protein n=1 Tax=Paracraurococcus ruber TaxID=77675 RepID=A0ABS1CXS2_9PROT|nr:hypothetical protein [Paracraurococcus ruber]MBK1658519.1 hypothetical protein [Paracraurococcus ruber]TDG32497.1 hypothetical protein E2C05_06965 [Paracraurococcus ruber]